jgi:hypothetical protein
MAGQERTHRFREKLHVELDRLCTWVGLNSKPQALNRTIRSEYFGSEDSGGGRFSFLDYLRSGPAQRFYFASTSRSEVARFFERHAPEWIESATVEADRLCRHHVSILGYGELDLGSHIDWHRDPITGRSWEKRFWADYDPVRKHTAGDPKTIHELNRHHHIARLAKAFFLSGQEKYAIEAVGQMESWIEQNPPFMGINWQSCLEIALRTAAWTWSLFFLLPSDALEESKARRIGASLFTQIEHICRYPSYYRSPNTHLIGEAMALFLAGIVFQEHRQASKWLRKGCEILITEMERQVSEEGVHRELSSWYHCYTLDFYLQALTLAKRNNLTLPANVWEKTSRMIDFLMHLSRPDGTIPLLGDDDGGRALALCGSDYRSFSDSLSTGAVLFSRPDFKGSAGFFREETFWLVGEEAWHVFKSLPSGRPASTTFSCPNAGYFIQRSDWDEGAAHLVFDCGGLGRLGGGHGHADALSFTLWSAGKDLLVDSGTFVYNGAPEWRDYFRSTRAHNTVTIDGHEQSEAGAAFRWKRKATTRILGEFILPEIECVSGEHDGYAQLPAGVIHRRRLLFLKPEYWVLVDSYHGEGEHRFEQNLHFSSDVELHVCKRDDNRAIQLLTRSGDAALDLALFAGVPVDARIIKGSEFPIQGWTSDRYGRKTAAAVLNSSFACSAPAAMITVIVPASNPPGLRGACTVRSLELAGGTAVGCTIVRGRRTDLFVVSPEASEVTAAGFRMAGEFFWIRTDDNSIGQFLAFEARHLSVKSKIIFDTREPVPYLSDNMLPPSRPDLRPSITSQCHVRNLRDHTLRYVQPGR